MEKGIVCGCWDGGSGEENYLEELSALKELLKRIETLLEEHLIGIEEPLADEVGAIEEYEGEKKSGEVELMRLGECFII